MSITRFQAPRNFWFFVTLVAFLMTSAWLIFRVDHGRRAQVRYEAAAGQHGIDVMPPVGWQRWPLDRPSLVAKFASPDSTAAAPKAVITVESAPAGRQRPEDVAAALAAEWGGRVADQPADLNGTAALRVVAEPRSAGFQYVQALIAERRGKLILIVAGAAGGRDLEADLAQVRGSFHWR